MEDKEYRREMGLVLEDVEGVMESLVAICDREDSDTRGEDDDISEVERRKGDDRIERLGLLISSIDDIRRSLEEEVGQG